MFNLCTEFTASGMSSVLCCLVLFTFIFNIFLTNEPMYIVMMIEKQILEKQRTIDHIIIFNDSVSKSCQ